MHGQAVCEAHGGMAPQNLKAGRRRVALAEAGRMAARAGVDMHPIDHLLDSLQRAYQLVLVYAIMVAAIDDQAEEDAAAHQTLRGDLGYRETTEDEPGELRVWSHDRLLVLNQQGLAHIHPYQAHYEKAIERHGRLAKLCLDAGVDERRIQLQEKEVRHAVDAFEAALTDISLSAAKRQEVRQAYARRLRGDVVQHGSRRRARPARADH